MAYQKFDFKVESDIPLKRIDHYQKWPFGDMEVGQSFFVPADLVVKVRAAVSWYGKRNNKKFATRKDGEGLRVWRLA